MQNNRKRSQELSYPLRFLLPNVLLLCPLGKGGQKGIDLPVPKPFVASPWYLLEEVAKAHSLPAHSLKVGRKTHQLMRVFASFQPGGMSFAATFQCTNCVSPIAGAKVCMILL